MSIEIGLNMEFVRRSEKPFPVGVEMAARMGYKYVEPMLHTGRELMSEAGYYHSVSMEKDSCQHGAAIRGRRVTGWF